MTSLHTPLAPVLYIPHGGGPMPLLGEPSHQRLVDFLRQIPASLPTPEAIVVISAHWEEERPTVTSGDRPDLIYDYSGFPQESYSIRYPAPGAPDLANRLHGLLAAAGLRPQADARRGFDHGLFVPLALMYPKAEIPCIQLSLLDSLDPAAHLAVGKALAPLRRERILIVGSGFSFHNMRAFFGPAGAPDQRNEDFQQWLIETCAAGDLTPDQRELRLADWENASHARYCHPREEHLLPLHVCYGMAQTQAQLVFDDQVLGKRACALLWQSSTAARRPGWE